jgi:K+-transporting ATPase KdpF subunit
LPCLDIADRYLCARVAGGWQFGTARPDEVCMTLLHWLGGVLAVLMLIYLFIALIKPEPFE